PGKSALLSLSHLPLSPGVYIFKDISGHTLYVGKANRLRQRVRSYFQPPVKLGPKTAQLVSHIASIEYIEVGSEIEALLLESSLIKKFRPHYNIASKDGTSPYYVHITREKYPKPVINHLPQAAIAGPFLSSLVARKILRSFRRISPFHTESPCFYRHLGLCRPCPDDPLTKSTDYNKNITRLKKLLRGQFKQVSRQAVKTLDFETAAALRNLLQQPTPPEEFVTNPNLLSDRRQEALETLHLALGTWPLARIEMYDVAHLAGSAATGAMTVAINGQLTPQNYRHFTIHSGNDDVARLEEMLTRRIKNNWPKPDLIVLDGGLPQLSLAHKALCGRAEPCAVIALAKQDEIIYTSTSQI
ncbi:MAG: GIY-YIG nuclease family protein, partial [Patescibacteria group bacterium]